MGRWAQAPSLASQGAVCGDGSRPVCRCLGPQLYLGMYPEEHFIEKPVKEAMARFRKNLDAIVSVIAERNKNKKLPYYYLSPDRIPNSVAI